MVNIYPGHYSFKISNPPFIFLCNSTEKFNVLCNCDRSLFSFKKFMNVIDYFHGVPKLVTLALLVIGIIFQLSTYKITLINQVKYEYLSFIIWQKWDKSKIANTYFIKVSLKRSRISLDATYDERFDWFDFHFILDDRYSNDKRSWWIYQQLFKITGRLDSCNSKINKEITEWSSEE